MPIGMRKTDAPLKIILLAAASVGALPQRPSDIRPKLVGLGLYRGLGWVYQVNTDPKR